MPLALEPNAVCSIQDLWREHDLASLAAVGVILACYAGIVVHRSPGEVDSGTCCVRSFVAPSRVPHLLTVSHDRPASCYGSRAHTPAHRSWLAIVLASYRVRARVWRVGARESCLRFTGRSSACYRRQAPHAHSRHSGLARSRSSMRDSHSEPPQTLGMNGLDLFLTSTHFPWSKFSTNAPIILGLPFVMDRSAWTRASAM